MKQRTEKESTIITFNKLFKPEAGVSVAEFESEKI